MTAVGQGASQATAGSFLGACAIRPLRRDLKNDFTNARGTDLVAASVPQVLGTSCLSGKINGELPWRPEFGSQLELLRFRNTGAMFEELARTYVVEALQRWEPRVLVRDVTVLDERNDDGGRTVSVRVVYAVRATRSPGSTVLTDDLDAIVPIVT